MLGSITMNNKKGLTILSSIATVNKLMLATCLLVLPATIQSCGSPAQSINITGATKSMQFKFEDYQTAEAAQKRLLELYPVGSDVSKFDRDMQSLGYKRVPGVPGIPPLGLGFQHFIPINAAGSNVWYVQANYNNDDNKITKLRVSYNFSSF
jgi:hypothetical protein